MKTEFKTLLQKNWKAGLAVSLISISLSLSLVIVSGVILIQGIITAI